LEAIERYSTSNDLLTLIILLVLILLVLARKLFPHRFEDFISLITSGKFLVIKSKEHKALFGFNVIMLITHILSISIFLYVLYRQFIGIENNAGILLLRITTAYSFFVLLKITVEKIIANVFDIDEIIDTYLYQKHTYRNFISLILFPASIILVYAQNPQPWIFYTIGGLYLIIIMFSYSRVIQKNMNIATRNWFYFILYLCTLEITPYIILYKLITLT